MSDHGVMNWDEWSERTTEPTREEWLEQAVLALETAFKAVHVRTRNVRVSCGFPAGARPSGKAKHLGQCWAPSAASDNVPQIFIHPSVSDAFKALDVLTHELIHAYIGVEHGHGDVFKRAALAVGFNGPMRSTTPGEQLTATLRGLAKLLGPYPHAKLNLNALKKQKTRMLKASCGQCGYTVRLTKSWADLGLPSCPLDGNPFTLEDKGA